MKSNLGSDSFTLIELLVVIAVLAVLSVAVIIALNPFEFAKQARDARRLSELQTINTSLGVYQTGGGIYLGSSTAVYVSIPDSSASCANLGLPTLPSGWGYQCASSSTYRNINGTGWISVDFTSGSYGPGLEKLPIDPINTTSSGNYYTYTPGGSWELNAILESAKYRFDSRITKTNLPGVLAVGNDLTRSPVYNTSGLVGYWKFDEGSGTTAGDASGNGNNGTLYNSPTWTTGKSNGALSFDGTNDYVSVPDSTVFNITDTISISLWVKPNTLSSWARIMGRGSAGVYGIERYGDNNSFWLAVYVGGNWQKSPSTGYSEGAWMYLTGTYSSATRIVGLYKNGIYVGGTTLSGLGDYTIGSTADTLRFGDLYGVRYFNGAIDDMRIYNRVLSAAEIAAIYNATR